MGHTASVNRQRRSPTLTLNGDPTSAAAEPRRSYTPSQMQALYFSRGRPDLAFLSNQGRMHSEVPGLQQTCTVKSYVNLKKSSLKLEQSLMNLQQYALEFRFDATKPCWISIYFVATETIDTKTGCCNIALTYSDKVPLLKKLFSIGSDQPFKLNATKKKIEDGHEVHEQPLPPLDFSLYDPDVLVYKSGSNEFPLIIVLEVSSDTDCSQSQTTFCTFFKNYEGAWTIKILKQKVLVDGSTYELQEIYGIDGSVTAAPRMERGEDRRQESSQAENDSINESAECIICLSEPRNTTILPCRHMCLCTECAEALRKISSTCPICRSRVESLLQICAD
ncbi:probable e3 ubiquitin-protein ligase log2-like [Plasmopara halstedii]|uniref:RING-type E3 ubiquitin transferase n=1 Tax=Plasmopara halstedii TaxID=4781 RepID=A0A0P1ANL2_PLAHL|nr:probable e3 ubiquitin-protein ligase log2-like [Plasmopara halstedii]CEG42789.1 probable e3 ubiquitin-protein ligase log2-like [Plasmopara halstedii]|eukprot:XP_024579158.1 probable e3 ubiquitin-protein ligase log2-like [Plasmopara halstedii]